LHQNRGFFKTNSGWEKTEGRVYIFVIGPPEDGGDLLQRRARQ
jgi:hypothetical protein